MKRKITRGQLSLDLSSAIRKKTTIVKSIQNSMSPPVIRVRRNTGLSREKLSRLYLFYHADSDSYWWDSMLKTILDFNVYDIVEVSDIPVHRKAAREAGVVEPRKSLMALHYKP